MRGGRSVVRVGGASDRLGQSRTGSGLAIGYGLEEEVLRAYRFIVENQEADDRLYHFGFSRGAYTARAVASLVHAIGLLRAGNDDLARYAWRLMSAWAGNRTRPLASGPDLVTEFKEAFSRAPCRIRFVGVWDTVSSVGWVTNPLRLSYTADNLGIDIGRHAVSIDERRAFFRTNLWRPGADGGLRDMRQVWFPGDHCDVGGGHASGGAAQADIALAWMLREARLAGLLTATDDPQGRGGVGPVPVLHDSLKGWWHWPSSSPNAALTSVLAGTLGA